MTANHDVGNFFFGRPELTAECAMQQLGASEEAEEVQPIS